MAKNIILKNGILAYNEKRYSDAIKYFKKMLDSPDEKDRNMASYYLGLTYTRLGDLNNAIESFRKLIKVNLPPEFDIRFRMILGYIYALKEKYPLSRDIFLSVLKREPKNVQVLAALGFIHYRMNEHKKAIQYLKKALKIDSNNPNALNSLGYIYAQLGERLDEAVKNCEKALSLKPDYPPYQDSVGWAYLKTGKITEAKKLLTAALEKMPDNDEIRNHFREIVLKEMLAAKKRDKTD